jgi:4-aminobutyrate aminotransferase-like enzyme
MGPSETIELLRRYESHNVTFIESDGSWPIVWKRARGVHVWDERGRKYLDLTAAFGVAAAGHANPRVVRAGQKQMAELLHAMGDVHPHRRKAELARKLSEITFERWHAEPGKTIFTNSGFEAVEAALKTSFLANGRSGVIAFQGGYHGLGYGALTTTHREHFRGPFRAQLKKFVRFVEFPETDQELGRTLEQVVRHFKSGKFGTVLVEPVQARAGIRIPPRSFLAELRKLCDQFDALLILDEVYTGFGRTGRWFACEHSSVIPDLICLGKALTGGFPLSVCVGKADLMDRAWPTSSGEAIHTSTFLGHPVGCAMALANIREIDRLGLIQASAEKGKLLLRSLCGLKADSLGLSPRGLGLMVGLELCDPSGKPATNKTIDIVKSLLHRGYILLPEGEHSNVISFTPPLTILPTQISSCLMSLETALPGLSRLRPRPETLSRDRERARSRKGRLKMELRP